MKKTFKNHDLPFSNHFKSSKTPLLKHSLTLPPHSQPNAQNKNERQVKVICPNCQFHFKVELKLLDTEDHGVSLLPKAQDSLQKLIDKQYSLISNFSRSGPYLENSPIVKLKNKPQIQDLICNNSMGLERLQLLNELNELQKSRLNDSKVTIRFNPSPKDSPIEQYSQTSPQISRISIRHHQVSQQLKPVQQNLIKSTVFDYFQALQLLTAITSWITSNQLDKNLPSYLKLLISDFQQKMNSIY